MNILGEGFELSQRDQSLSLQTPCAHVLTLLLVIQCYQVFLYTLVLLHLCYYVACFLDFLLMSFYGFCLRDEEEHTSTEHFDEGCTNICIIMLKSRRTKKRRRGRRKKKAMREDDFIHKCAQKATTRRTASLMSNNTNSINE